MKNRTNNGWTRLPMPWYRSPIAVLVALVVFGLAAGFAEHKFSSSEEAHAYQPAPVTDGCGGLISGYACRLEQKIEAATN